MCFNSAFGNLVAILEAVGRVLKNASAVNNCFRSLTQKKQVTCLSIAVKRRNRDLISRVYFAGPLSYTSRNQIGRIETATGGKAYLSLFTCAVMRAVYLELSPDLTAENFVFTLTRFYLRVNQGPRNILR